MKDERSTLEGNLTRKDEEKKEGQAQDEKGTQTKQENDKVRNRKEGGPPGAPANRPQESM